MRPPTACDFCRSRRRRCQWGNTDGRRCELCRKHNVQCLSTASSAASSRSSTLIHTPSASRSAPNARTSTPLQHDTTPRSSTQSGPSHSPAVTSAPEHESSSSSSDAETPPIATCYHLANLYFDYVHDQLHTLFQKPAFMSDMALGRTSPVIMFAMIALAARFSSHELFAGTSPRTRGVKYAQKSARLLDLSDVSLTSIQACVMLGACRIIEGDAAGESVYYGIACRMAQLLDLPHRQCVNRLEREVNIRVWHTLCMVDEWSSSGVQVPRQIANPPEDVPLPMEEMTFLQLRTQDTWDDVFSSPFSPASSSSSLLAQMISLNRIFREVNKMNTQTAVGSEILPPDTDAVETIAKKLDEWELQLPSYMRDEPSNLAHYAARGLGRIYVAVYLGYYHYGQLMYYQFLHAATEENGGIAQVFAARCKSHAARLCDMVYAALDTPGCDVLYNMVGHVLVIASTVQIHALLFSSDAAEISAARQRLERNFNILLRLRELWPSLDFCMMRLQAFHKACRNSMDNSFKLDRWMLKFLSEFAKPVDDKPENKEMEWIIGDIAITPTSDFGVNSMATVINMDRNI